MLDNGPDFRAAQFRALIIKDYQPDQGLCTVLAIAE